MKIIFLDLDGVINNIGENGVNLSLPLFSTKRNKESILTRFSTDNVPSFLSLLELCQKYNYKIVISSTWRLFTDSADDFNKYFRKYFKYIFIKSVKEDLVVGVTPHLNTARGEEILSYVNDYGVEYYIVIDDSISDIENIIESDKIVRIDIQTGITEEDIIIIEEKMKK